MTNLAKYISPIQDIIDDVAAGKPVIMVDDADRENEGDVIIPAETITNEQMAFLFTECRGLVCTPMTNKRAEELNLPLSPRMGVDDDWTAFTLSVDAAKNITTGISAADRVETVSVLCNHNQCAADIVSPGHIFPLIAKEGGVLERPGHTEASVDLMNAAGRTPVAVICEILNADGTLSRMPDLVEFSNRHDMKIGKVADLIAYRLNNESESASSSAQLG